MVRTSADEGRRDISGGSNVCLKAERWEHRWKELLSQEAEWLLVYNTTFDILGFYGMETTPKRILCELNEMRCQAENLAFNKR